VTVGPHAKELALDQLSEDEIKHEIEQARKPRERRKRGKTDPP